MQIILSPAKEMFLSNPLKKDWEIKEETKEIIKILESLEIDQLEKLLKVKDKILLENIEYIKGFKKPVSYPALQLYNGLAFRNIDKEGLDEEANKYLKDHLKILSALYGPIGPFEKIKPYRLDLTMPLRVQGKSLKSFWKEYYKEYFKKGQTILNLASNEFSQLLDKENYQWIDFDFYQVEKGKIKKHSTISKKARGKMLQYLAKNKIQDIEEIKNFDLDGYSYDADSSSEGRLVFEKRE